MNQPELGKKILELRLQRGLTQKELAETCKVSLRTIQRIESEKGTPRSHTVKVILSNLGYESSMNLSNDEPFNYNKPTTRFVQFLKGVLELFNLKTNTMKKLSVLTLITISLIWGISITSNHLKAQKIQGWFLAGNKSESYIIGLDDSVYKTGNTSAFLESTNKEINGFGTLMQSCSADEFLGKRIKMTAYIKSEKVMDWAGMWFRVDSRKTGNMLSFDNMQDRPIRGDRDWTKCEITLDVPEESGALSFGVLLSGTGKVWFDNVVFEVVDKLKTKPTRESVINKEPINLDFGE